MRKSMGMYPTNTGVWIVGVLMVVSMIVLIVGAQLNNANAIYSGAFIMVGVVSAVMGKIYYEATQRTVPQP
jgi:hypothetical protein